MSASKGGCVCQTAGVSAVARLREVRLQKEEATLGLERGVKGSVQVQGGVAQRQRPGRGLELCDLGSVPPPSGLTSLSGAGAYS